MKRSVMKRIPSFFDTRTKVVATIIGLGFFIVAGAPLGIFMGTVGGHTIVYKLSGGVEPGSALEAVGVILGVFVGIVGFLLLTVGGGAYVGWAIDLARRGETAPEAASEEAAPMPWGARIAMVAGWVVGIPVAVLFGTYNGGSLGIFLAEKIWGPMQGFSLAGVAAASAGAATGALVFLAATVGAFTFIGGAAQFTGELASGLFAVLEDRTKRKLLAFSDNPGMVRGRTIGLKVGVLAFAAIGLVLGIAYGRMLGTTVSQEVGLTGGSAGGGALVVFSTVLGVLSIGAILLVVATAMGAFIGYLVSIGRTIRRIQTGQEVYASRT